MSDRIIPLIMCGGAGTRLWPASRAVHPKQFLPLFGPRSTFQETLLRLSDAAFFERPIVITNTAYRFLVLEQLAEIGLKADVLLEPPRRDAGPAIATGAGRDLGFVTLHSEAFEKAKAISIDYAVMEKTTHAAVVPMACGWSDVGSWHAVWELSGKDSEGNAAQGTAVFEDSRNCNVSTDKALVALEGVDDLVVVATQDAVLVSRQKDANGLKRLVAKLKAVAPQVTEDHLKVHRPWGSYQSIDSGDRHQVKRIIVKPGGRLSLQKHHHRSEHWIVVRGAARVTVNDLVKTVHENESIYIPIGATHRMENPGKIPLELIEVQTGSYLGEDDIIRIEDDYQRS